MKTNHRRLFVDDYSPSSKESLFFKRETKRENRQDAKRVIQEQLSEVEHQAAMAD